VSFPLILAVIGSLFVAFNNGANDVANAFAAAVGAKALKLKHALFIAAILNFFGAIFLGSNVSRALIGGIVNVRHFTDANAYIAGMLASMVAAGSFICISTRTGLPVSSTHAIVGGIMGVAAVIGGVDAINWKFFVTLTLSWIFTPFLSALCSLCAIKLIRMAIYRGASEKIMERACNWIPIFASAVSMASMAIVAIGIGTWREYIRRCGISLLLLIPALYIVFRWITRKLAIKFSGREFGIEHVFRRFQAGTSALVGFAIGSNDVANSITPVIAIYFATKVGVISGAFADFQIPIWLLAIGGLGMSTGVLSLGHKVIGTMGRSIALLTNSRGFSVDFSTAMTIILASVFGIPISSTHAATGAIIGVGLENGIGGLNVRMILRIFLTWLVTVPLSAAFAIFVYFILRMFMLLAI
jgi:PiT family inorganic phosphate transporter